MKPQNLIALLLFIVGAVWALTRSERSVRNIQSTYYSAISPFLKGGAAIETKASEFIQEVEHSKALEMKYKLAKEELDQKRMEVAHLRKLEAENTHLNQALEVPRERSLSCACRKNHSSPTINMVAHRHH